MNEARIRSLDALVEWRSSMIVFQTKARRSVSQITDPVVLDDKRARIEAAIARAQAAKAAGPKT